MNRGQVLAVHKSKVKDIILSQYRSQRAFAGILTGRKNLRHDNLKSTIGNSSLINIRSFADLTNAENGNARLVADSVEVSNDSVVHLNGRGDNKNFYHKLENLKDRYTHDQFTEGGEKLFEVEAFLIMTGEVNFLSRHVIAFIRLMDEHFVCKYIEFKQYKLHSVKKYRDVSGCVINHIFFFPFGETDIFHRAHENEHSSYGTALK